MYGQLQQFGGDAHLRHASLLGTFDCSCIFFVIIIKTFFYFFSNLLSSFPCICFFSSLCWRIHHSTHHAAAAALQVRQTSENRSTNRHFTNCFLSLNRNLSKDIHKDKKKEKIKEIILLSNMSDKNVAFEDTGANSSSLHAENSALHFFLNNAQPGTLKKIVEGEGGLFY